MVIDLFLPEERQRIMFPRGEAPLILTLTNLLKVRLTVKTDVG